MKISKKQLKQIIKEERRKILNEMVSPSSEYSYSYKADLVDQAIALLEKAIQYDSDMYSQGHQGAEPDEGILEAISILENTLEGLSMGITYEQ